MFTCLSPGAVGIKLPWEECLPLAHDNGFAGIDIQIDLQKSPAWYTDQLAAHRLRPGGMVLPVDFRADEPKYRAGLEELPKIAAFAHSIALTRFIIWIIPCSDTLTFKQNFAFHVDRLRPCAKIFADHGCRLALEFIGPRTSRVGRRYPFVRTLEQMLDLCEHVGGNTGVLLDSWHWYTSLGVPEDIRALSENQVVYVHVNDAPANLPVDQQKDNARALPGATGVQDIAAFIHALREIRYDGPIVAEPFDATLKELPPQESARRTAASLKRILG